MIDIAENERRYQAMLTGQCRTMTRRVGNAQIIEQILPWGKLLPIDPPEEHNG